MSRLETEVQRNRYADDRNGLDVFAAESGVLATLEGSLRAGRFVDGGMGELPAVVLGAVAAERLGISDISAGPTVWIAGRELTVIGILVRLCFNIHLIIGKACTKPAILPFWRIFRKRECQNDRYF
jgi:hypothetical protein